MLDVVVFGGRAITEVVAGAIWEDEAAGCTGLVLKEHCFSTAGGGEMAPALVLE